MANKVSIFAAVCKTLDLAGFKEFVNSVEMYTGYPYEFIIINNGAFEDVSLYLDEWVKRSLVGVDKRLIVNKENMGVNVANHQGLHACTTDYIIRLDSDVVIKTPDWANKMVRYSLDYPEVGMVCTKGNAGQSYRIQRDNYTEVDIMIGWCQFVHRKVINRISEYFRARRDDLMNHICALRSLTNNPEKIRHLKDFKIYVKECAKGGTAGVGMFWDPGYFYGTEDFELSLLCRLVGYRIAIAEDVDVDHKDVAMRPDFLGSRKILTHDAFNYFRLKWEILLDFFDWRGQWEPWDSLPPNIEYQNEWRKTQEEKK